MLSEEQKLKNLSLFFKKLNEVGVNTEKLQSIYGEQVLNATFGMSNDLSVAYDGSLLQTILRIFTPYAINMNSLLPETVRVSNESLIKVCLLHQLSKATMFIPNDNSWEKEKRGLLYKYAPYEFAFKMGMRSLVICQECDITLTPMEIEALTILDRDVTDEQARFRCNTLSVIIRQANEVTNLIIKHNNPL